MNLAMADCSRNAVLNVASAKQMIELLALMGYSTFEFYRKDTCIQIEGQPYFGYFVESTQLKSYKRKSESYAQRMTTFVPCIKPWLTYQPLCQMGVKKCSNSAMWGDILLIGEKKVYDLIDMFATLHLSYKLVRSTSGWRSPLGWFEALLLI